MEVISDFVKKRGILKVLGIGGPTKFSWRTLREFKTLREKYRVHIIPKDDLDQW
ncbi:hypothetical protein RhiirC2_728099 [Rhizophagus irregularis]|nr:hypothetical protein RhiirC2_728099 [Rhizophagus irregularis]PKY40061.1 hypothetical protein RhiirA4_394188 [Rhizophagus irregularis]